MERTSCKTDFQSWKGIMALKLLCCNIIAGRFDWKKYCRPLANVCKIRENKNSKNPCNY